MEIKNKINKIKSDIGYIRKDVKNEFANYKYAELTQIFEKIQKLLIENQLCIDIVSVKPNIEMCNIFQKLYYDFMIEITSDGKSEQRIYTFPADEEGKKMKMIQAAGSTFTYAQRYIYGAIFSLQFEIDPDSNQSEKPNENQSQNNNQKQITEWLSESQFNIALQSGEKGIEATLKTYNNSETKGMKKEYREKLKQKLQEYKNQ